VSREQHPAGRSRKVQTLVDDLDLREWWQVEEAVARRENATTRLLHTLAWSVAALTATLVVITLLDAIRGA
jgi:hypothetical protein